MENQHELAGKKILWVEDDELLGDVVGKVISNHGATVTRALDGEQALKALESLTPDAIVLDILLPKVDGFEVLAKVRENPKIKNVPVILFSNLSSKADIEKGVSLGANKFIVKATIVPNKIVAEIVDLLK